MILYICNENNLVHAMIIRYWIITYLVFQKLMMAIHIFLLKAFHKVHYHFTQKSIKYLFSILFNIFGSPLLIYCWKDKRLQCIYGNALFQYNEISFFSDQTSWTIWPWKVDGPWCWLGQRLTNIMSYPISWGRGHAQYIISA